MKQESRVNATLPKPSEATPKADYKEEQKKQRMVARMAVKTNPGYEWNPLRTHERNAPCPCGSNVKFKKCCLDKLPYAVEVKSAAIVKAGMVGRRIKDDVQAEIVEQKNTGAET